MCERNFAPGVLWGRNAQSRVQRKISSLRSPRLSGTKENRPERRTIVPNEGPLLWSSPEPASAPATVPVALSTHVPVMAIIVAGLSVAEIIAAGGSCRKPSREGVGTATHAAVVVVRAVLGLPAVVTYSAAFVAAVFDVLLHDNRCSHVWLSLERQQLTVRPGFEPRAC